MTTRHTALTSTFTNILDSTLYDETVQGPGRIDPLNKSLNKTLVIIRCKSTSYISLLLLLLLQMAIPMPALATGYSIDVLRVYAHSRIVNYKEFKCMDSIIMSESRYNYLARNGSHYGIGQMRSKHYQSKDPFTQIDLTIAYSLKRYKSLCNALTFHKRHGYY